MLQWNGEKWITIAAESLIRYFYRDKDGDGFGDKTQAVGGITAPDGFVANNSDWDDNNPATNPVAIEVCDGIDNNCNRLIDEGFDKDSDGYRVCGTRNGPAGTYLKPTATLADCNDQNPNLHPGLPVLLDDGIDNNCDGADGTAALAVFVSVNGNNSNPGTRDLPVRTINRGLQLAAESARNQVY